MAKLAIKNFDGATLFNIEETNVDEARGTFLVFVVHSNRIALQIWVCKSESVVEIIGEISLHDGVCYNHLGIGERKQVRPRFTVRNATILHDYLAIVITDAEQDGTAISRDYPSEVAIINGNIGSVSG